MLIDARHPEETRVAVLKGNRIEEFDFDSADHKQIKGNIYLAKVTRVEPSLQAAFVDFGGNRHGFLAFSEIHPDYYQIPKEDREALLAEEAAHAAEEAALRAAEEAEEDAYAASGGNYAENGATYSEEGYASDDYAGEGNDHGSVIEIDTSEKDDVATIEDGHVAHGFDGDFDNGSEETEGFEGRDSESVDESGQDSDEDGGNGQGRRRGRRQGQGSGQGLARGQAKDTRGQADDLRARRMALRRRYKIQDVIQRRQVLLVQVVKEERGNKGAALTSYLSLAGRYCVLMPNSSHGGGISRKINSVADRKRLKSIVSEMALPKSMGCIVRTAGLQRTKVEIKRDFDYLARLWDDIRDTTLHSSAPALIHSDSDLIKRAIRDIYNRDIEEVIVEGESGYRLARDFMKLLMPSHARRVKAYIDPVPLFQRFGAEDQLTAMYDPVVQLKSGGYIVINPTEALVSIDINSGRSTKEHGIEATAVNTNLEAAREIARQLRLRDMAGLVVIDFIDMEYGSNVRKVEKAMKDALKDDRARIQVGRISGFGLMEMSRQRLRTGVLEATTRSCPHCDGTGLVRTAASAGLSALRLIEEEAAKGRGIVITLFASQEAAIYVLNAKRADLAEIEARYGVSVEVIPEGENEGAKMRVASSGPRNEFVPKFEAVAYLEEEDDDLPEEEDDEIDDDVEDEVQAREPRRREPAAERDVEEGGDRAPVERSAEAGASGDARRKRRKRRRGRNREAGDEQAGKDGAADTTLDATDEPVDEAGEPGEFDEAEPAEGASGSAAEARDASEETEAQAKRRRRGRRRRGGRNRGEPGSGETAEVSGEAGSGEEQGEDGDAPFESSPDLVEAEGTDTLPVVEASATDVTAASEAPAPKKRARRKKADAVAAEDAPPTVDAEADVAAPAEKPKRARRKQAETSAAVEAVADAPAPAKPARRKKADAVPVANVSAEEEVEPIGEQPLTPRPAADMVQASVTDSAAGGDAANSDDPAEEPRRGWWQRTFGA
jgi:ribonuclease E